MRRILFLARAEVLHVVRDRATLAQVLVRAGRPAARAVECGHVRDPRHADLRRRLRSDRATSRGLINRFAASGHFRIVGRSASLDLRERRACCAASVTLVVVDPARLRGVAGPDRRRAGAARRSTRRRARPRASCSRTPREILDDVFARAERDAAADHGERAVTARCRPPARGGAPASRSACAAGTTRR